MSVVEDGATIDGYATSEAPETAVERAVRKVKANNGETNMDAALVVLGPPFLFGAHGLTVNGKGKHKPTIQACGEALERLQRVKGAIRYNMGDLIRYIEREHKEEAAQFVDAGLLDDRETKEERYVTENVAPDVRELAKSWDHAKAIAGVPQPKQRKLLQLSLDENWTASKLKSEAEAATSKDGKAGVKFWLIVECGSEPKQEKLADRLEAEGFTIKKKSGIKRAKVAKKPAATKRIAKGAVTARKRRASKRNTRRRAEL